MSEREDCGLDIFVDEDGVNIVTFDADIDIYYHWIIEDGKVIDMIVGHILEDIILPQERNNE